MSLAFSESKTYLRAPGSGAITGDSAFQPRAVSLTVSADGDAEQRVHGRFPVRGDHLDHPGHRGAARGWPAVRRRLPGHGRGLPGILPVQLEGVQHDVLRRRLHRADRHAACRDQRRRPAVGPGRRQARPGDLVRRPQDRGPGHRRHPRHQRQTTTSSSPCSPSSPAASREAASTPTPCSGPGRTATPTRPGRWTPPSPITATPATPPSPGRSCPGWKDSWPTTRP